MSYSLHATWIGLLHRHSDVYTFFAWAAWFSADMFYIAWSAWALSSSVDTRALQSKLGLSELSGLVQTCCIHHSACMGFVSQRRRILVYTQLAWAFCFNSLIVYLEDQGNLNIPLKKDMPIH